MTEAEARDLLRRCDGQGGIEAWIAARRWQAVPGGWAVRSELEGWRFTGPCGAGLSRLAKSRSPSADRISLPPRAISSRSLAAPPHVVSLRVVARVHQPRPCTAQGYHDAVGAKVKHRAHRRALRSPSVDFCPRGVIGQCSRPSQWPAWLAARARRLQKEAAELVCMKPYQRRKLRSCSETNSTIMRCVDGS
jgi:hypothetical protein